MVDDGKDDLKVKDNGNEHAQKKNNTKDTEISENWYGTHRLHMYMKSHYFIIF